MPQCQNDALYNNLEAWTSSLLTLRDRNQSLAALTSVILSFKTQF